MPLEIATHVGAGNLSAAKALPEMRALFVAAAEILAENPEVARVVAALTGTVHVLAAEPGYDISHSEPSWHDRIFVSFPERDDRVGALRLAESVLHEAMHLHLTLFEQHTPCVEATEGEIHSPWRKAPRPYGGVLHGLFVFRCLADFMAGLNEAPGSPAADHVARRLIEIQGEISDVDVEALAEGLTPAGHALARRLAPRDVDSSARRFRVVEESASI
jgi:HEXXH motif-containing protein